MSTTAHLAWQKIQYSSLYFDSVTDIDFDLFYVDLYTSSHHFGYSIISTIFLPNIIYYSSKYFVFCLRTPWT